MGVLNEKRCKRTIDKLKYELKFLNETFKQITNTRSDAPREKVKLKVYEEMY
jgi:hypothetical protein